MSLFLLAAWPFLGALAVGLVSRAGRGAVLGAALAANGAALLGVLGHIPALAGGAVLRAQVPWLPSAGLNLHLMLDGLGLLFALLILGIGLLILIYARHYLAEGEAFARFYTYLMLFQGAMLGIVLADNVLLLLLFWEMTSLSSFLLIGYWSQDAAARRGARMALVITGGGGLALFAGLLMLAQAAGGYDLTHILGQRAAVQASPLFLPALGLIVLGAFAKSAQFPLHFWLPHAMAAPTPVSAYLHSATMVKAGLFLLARLWPVLAGGEAWFYLVATTGLVTMVLAAKVALFQDDLKAILAYSTISHLGLITFLLGLGSAAGMVAALAHVIMHATFKAPLFMVAGMVDHAAHTRDIRALGGLRRAMPISFALAVLAGLSMAGAPPLNGYLSKEMALELAAHTPWAGLGWPVVLLAASGALLSVAYTLRLVAGVFLGPSRAALSGVHEAGAGLWAPPAVLVALVVAIGLVPMPLVGGLVQLAANAAVGAGAAQVPVPVPVKIVHWHGWHSPALWISVLAFAGGGAVLAAYAPLRRMWDAFPRPEGRALFAAGQRGLIALARGAVLPLHQGQLARYLAIAVAAVLMLAAYGFGTAPAPLGPPVAQALPLGVADALAAAVFLAALVAAVWWHRQRVLALLLVGVLGLLIAAGFARLSAPDLALTQIAVEVVTVILMLLALNMLPKTTPPSPGRIAQGGAVALAALAGLGTAALAYALMMRQAAFAPISAFHLAQSKPGAGGTNAVNTIIVDFRGFDTYGEIIVLGIAALIIAALTHGLLAHRGVRARLDPIFPMAGRAGDRHPMMLVVATRLLLPMGMMIGVYIYLRGHNLPGGGFVAGLVFAIALLLQYIASGYGWSVARQRVNYQAMIGAGVLVASATGLGSWAAGRPFLTSNFTYVHLPPLETFELATAALFDLGVFLCVLGAVMLALDNLARLARAGGESTQARPFDTALAKGQTGGQR